MVSLADGAHPCAAFIDLELPATNEGVVVLNAWVQLAVGRLVDLLIGRLNVPVPLGEHARRLEMGHELLEELDGLLPLRIWIER